MLKDGKKGYFGLRLTILSALFMLMPAALVLASAHIDDDDKKPRPLVSNEYITPGWVVVKFKSGTQVSASASKTGIRSVDAVGEQFSVTAIKKMFPVLDNLSAGKKSTLKGANRFQSLYKMQFDPAKDPVAMAAMLSRLPEVAYAEPLYRDKTMRIETAPAWFEPVPSLMATPNDPRFLDQVYFDRFFIKEAWDVVKGEQGNVVVAVTDGGTDWTHEDMQANLWTNPGETLNGGDTDLNGFVDDLNGWNFANNTNDPKGLTNTPQNAQHGTQTAGLVAAQSDNGTGISGTSWNATYMPINISCPDNDDALCFALDGYMYAIANGADIINASLGSAFRSNVGQEVMDFAHENGVVFIAAAGNNNRNNNDIFPYYPANYNHVLSVGATSRASDALTSFTHIGVSVDVFAPGSAILTTSPLNGYLTASGTSFSAPIVAGVAALVKTQHPTWNADQVREQIRATADDILASNAGLANQLGKGRVNALRAVTEATPSVRIVKSSVRDASGSSRIDPGEVATIFLDVTNFLEPVSNLNITLETNALGLNITQPSATISSLNPGDTTTVEFRVQPAFNVDSNLQAVIVAKMSSGNYTDIDAFSIIANSTIHDTGNIQVTLTDQGNLGYEGFQGNSAGNGFRYLGFDFLFEGGLVTGNSVSTISDNVRGADTEQDDDFVKVAGTNFGIIDGRETTEEGALQIVDSAADQPLNISIRQDSYADTSEAYRDFVVLKYTIENLGTEVISDYYAGLFFDWDSFDDPQSDHARYDAARKMGYFLNNTPEMADVFLATKMLTNNGVTFRAIDNTTEIYGNTGAGDPNDGFTNQEKWDFISNGIQVASLDVTDISVILSGGPFEIPAGGSIEVAFALVGGTTQAEIEENADAAQALWDNTLSLLSPNPVANEDAEILPAFTFGLAEPFPNPAKQEAVVNFELPSPAEVQLRVFDMLGREVRMLVNKTMPAGKHSVVWDSRDNAGTPLASGVYMINLTAPTPDGPQTATKKVVLVR